MGHGSGDIQMNQKWPEPLIRAAANGLIQGDAYFREVLEALPVAVYTTDAGGRITFFNEAAAALWGHRPKLGDAQWCGSWKLYWPDGTPLPHDQCPMAVTLREGRAVRDVEAVAERPDGTRVPFLPFPTPLFDASGTLVGAVNMLMDLTDRKRAGAVRTAAWRDRRVLRRRDREQESQRHHHQLEPRGGAAFRLYRR